MSPNNLNHLISYNPIIDYNDLIYEQEYIDDKEYYNEICDVCDGTGIGKNDEKVNEDGRRTCYFCNGHGKVNWLDKIFRRPRTKRINIYKEIISKCSEELANEMDKEILKSIVKSTGIPSEYLIGKEKE